MGSLQTNRERWDHIWTTEGTGKDLDRLSTSMLGVLTSLYPSWGCTRVLEAGSGTGRISIELAKQGAAVSLLDMSGVALERARAFAQGLGVDLICGDLLRLPFASGQFGLTWNGGVLEHLSARELDIAVSEMARVTRPGGYVVAFNPNRASVPYRIGKRLQERRGAWIYGYEDPVRSLAKPYRKNGIRLLSESDLGVAQGFSFIPGVRRGLRVLERAERPLRFLGLRGYLVASIGIKEASHPEVQVSSAQPGASTFG